MNVGEIIKERRADVQDSITRRHVTLDSLRREIDEQETKLREELNNLIEIDKVLEYMED